MGHFLNLLHIWGQDQSCTSDDLVKDTPPQQFPYFGCAEASFQCGEREMIHNYMDYVDDTCMFYFSKGQVNRMWACIEGPRKSLIENQNEPPSMLFPAENPFLIKYISGLQEIHIYFADDFVLTELLVYSLDGKRLLNLKGPVQDYLKIDAQQWETGPYIVCLQSNEKKWTEKLIKIY
jgi:hypothetical protein